MTNTSHDVLGSTEPQTEVKGHAKIKLLLIFYSNSFQWLLQQAVHIYDILTIVLKGKKNEEEKH